MSEIVIVLAIIALLITSGVALIIQYRSLSSRLEVVTNLHSAKILVEGLVRNSLVKENIEEVIAKLSEYPGFEDTEAELIDAVDTKNGMIFTVKLFDKRIAREEEFYVYRFDPFKE